MKKLIGALILCVLTSSCKDEVDGGHLREFDTEKNVTINVGEPNNPYTLTDGSQIVFRYTFNHPHEENIADDELTEVFIFAIDADQSSFEITTTDVAGGSVFPMAYRRICFCFFEFGFTIQSVSVTGTKISPTKWSVSFEMTASDGAHTFDLSDQGTYNLADF